MIKSKHVIKRPGSPKKLRKALVIRPGSKNRPTRILDCRYEYWQWKAW